MEERQNWKRGSLFAVTVMLVSSVAVQVSLAQEPEGETVRDSNPEVNEEALQSLVDGGNTFAFDTFHQLRQGEGDLFFSPFSISQALGMTFAGARNDTEAQMQTVMHFDLGQEIHPAMNRLDLELASRAEGGEEWERGERPVLNIANSIWAQQNYELLATFVATLIAQYGIEARRLDFGADPEAARQTINGWVSERTEERIEDLIPEDVLTADTRLVLTNAIYFKANWLSVFSEHATRDDTFHLLGGEDVLVPMMNKREHFQHLSNDTVQVVELPYEGRQLSMLVVIPQEGHFEDVQAGLSPEGLTTWLNSLESGEVELALPKFRVESGFQLAEMLKALGMPIAFDPAAADFSGIATITTPADNLYISAVIHKAFIEIDEQGTEAAAATAVVIARAGSAFVPDPPPPTPIRADRPFFVVIRDNPTGAILFLGRVMDPR